ncbi:MAG: GDSL-type esterase/lipase family protein [Chthoniobacterales bacterium]
MLLSTVRFEDEVAAFELADRLSAPPLAPVLLYGSSTIRLWDSAEADFPSWPLVRRGIGGATLKECVGWSDRLLIRYAPSRVILYAGDNDLADGASPEEVMHQFQLLVHKIRHALGEVPLLFISIKPSPARWAIRAKILHTNHLIQSLIKHHRHLQYVDIVPEMLNSHGLPRQELYLEDGLHLSPEGYRVWAERLRLESDF